MKKYCTYALGLQNNIVFIATQLVYIPFRLCKLAFHVCIREDFLLKWLSDNGKELLKSAVIAEIEFIVHRWKSLLSVGGDYFQERGNLAPLKRISLKLKGKLKMFSSLSLDTGNEKIHNMHEYIYIYLSFILLIKSLWNQINMVPHVHYMAFLEKQKTSFK